MRNFLLTLLVFVMLTPGLACAGFMDNQKPSMAMAGLSKGMPCCPKSDPQSDMGTKLFKDCAKIDLQHADNAPLLKKSDIAKVFLPVIGTQDQSNAFSPASLEIRGSPPERLSASETHPPILLSFGRLRI